MRARAFSSLVGAAIAVVVFVAGAKAQDGVALVPFVVTNVEATIKAERGDFFKVLFVGAAAVDTLKIPFGTATSVTHRARDARNNAPVITNSRGRVSLNLPGQHYNAAEISLYAVNGRRVLRTNANAAETSKSISRPSLAPGVYLLAVKGANGQSFTSRLIHSGGGLNINVSFGDNNMFSASPSVAGLSRQAMAEETEEWTITVSEPGYADSVYTLTVVEGLNPLQEIELERIVEIIEIDTAYIPFTVNVAAKVRAVLMDGSDAILADFGTTVVEAGEMFSLEIPLNHSFMLVRGWTITVSADGYVDSTYTLNIVKGWNNEQVITLIPVPKIAHVPFVVNVDATVEATHDGNDPVSINATAGGVADTLKIPLDSDSMEWTITVSAEGYVDSTYTLDVVDGVNDVQNITLRIKPDGGELTPGGQFNPSITYGSFTDSRDGQTYRTVTIGTQTWMAENLNYATSGSWCYDDDSANCDLYGRLYDWSMVMGFASSCNTEECADQIQSPHRGICPAGWHVPSDAEWTTLVNFVGGSSTAGTRLRALTGWEPRSGTLIPGTDVHGFSALPGGNRNTDGDFWNVGTYGYWWSATEGGATGAWNRNMISGTISVSRYGWDKRSGLSLRCVR